MVRLKRFFREVAVESCAARVTAGLSGTVIRRLGFFDPAQVATSKTVYAKCLTCGLDGNVIELKEQNTS